MIKSKNLLEGILLFHVTSLALFVIAAIFDDVVLTVVGWIILILTLGVQFVIEPKIRRRERMQPVVDVLVK